MGFMMQVQSAENGFVVSVAGMMGMRAWVAKDWDEVERIQREIVLGPALPKLDVPDSFLKAWGEPPELDEARPEFKEGLREEMLERWRRQLRGE